MQQLKRENVCVGFGDQKLQQQQNLPLVSKLSCHNVKLERCNRQTFLLPEIIVILSRKMSQLPSSAALLVILQPAVV